MSSHLQALHIIASLSWERGGPSYAVRAMARALNSVDVDVTIATTDDNGDNARLPVPDGEPIKEEGATIYYFRRNILPYKVSFGLARWLHANTARFDVVHIHGLFSFSCTVAAKTARRHGVPYIVRPLGVLNRWGLHNRRTVPKLISLRLLEFPILRDAAAIHYTSEAEKLEASTISNMIASQNSAVIPLPIYPVKGDPEDFRRRFPQIAGRRMILFLSRIDEKKGIELLLDAFANVRERVAGTVLVIAGDGAEHYLQKLRQRAIGLAIAEDVVWTGHLSGAIKAGAFAAADVFVLPSYSENFGVAAAEALAHGVAIVITEGVAISREVLEHRAGVVVSCCSEAIAAATRQLLGAPEVRNRLAVAGKELAISKFSPRSIAPVIKELYRAAIASSG